MQRNCIFQYVAKQIMLIKRKTTQRGVLHYYGPFKSQRNNHPNMWGQYSINDVKTDESVLSIELEREN